MTHPMNEVKRRPIRDYNFAMLSLTFIGDADKVVPTDHSLCNALFKKKNLLELRNLKYDTKMFPLAAKKKCLVK